ncbi:MAG: 16S rRNA (cytidine(1402)-2'-O)-methyltransferase [Verrucomicrobiota bacterium]
MDGKLYIVGTPIGNLEDLSARALRILREVDLIAAEDTRHTGILLKHYEIPVSQVSYHKFNEARRLEELTSKLEAGGRVALVSDAGMPGVSDPGERIIHVCLERDIPVEVIPGPSAVIHALVASGFSMTPFYFGGFFPVKSGGRARVVGEALERDCTSVYFESPHRMVKTVQAFNEANPECMICVARELTKKFEEVNIGRPETILERYGTGKVKGELCLVIAGSSERH